MWPTTPNWNGGVKLLATRSGGWNCDKNLEGFDCMCPQVTAGQFFADVWTWGGPPSSVINELGWNDHYGSSYYRSPAMWTLPSDPNLLLGGFTLNVNGCQNGFGMSITGNSATGALTQQTCGDIRGWACDSDNFASDLLIEVYLDDANNDRSGSEFLMALTANSTNSAASSSCGGDASHGFQIPVNTLSDALKTKLLNGTTHTLTFWARGVKADGSDEGIPIRIGTYNYPANCCSDPNVACLATVQGNLFDSSVGSCATPTIGPVANGSVNGLAGLNAFTTTSNASGYYSALARVVTNPTVYDITFANMGGYNPTAEVICTTPNGTQASVSAHGQVVTRNYGFRRTFDSWFQVKGGSIRAEAAGENSIVSKIPFTCNTDPNCFASLVRSDGIQGTPAELLGGVGSTERLDAVGSVSSNDVTSRATAPFLRRYVSEEGSMLSLSVDYDVDENNYPKWSSILTGSMPATLITDQNAFPGSPSTFLTFDRIMYDDASPKILQGIWYNNGSANVGYSRSGTLGQDRNYDFNVANNPLHAWSGPISFSSPIFNPSFGDYTAAASYQEGVNPNRRLIQSIYQDGKRYTRNLTVGSDGNIAWTATSFTGPTNVDGSGNPILPGRSGSLLAVDERLYGTIPVYEQEFWRGSEGFMRRFKVDPSTRLREPNESNAGSWSIAPGYHQLLGFVVVGDPASALTNRVQTVPTGTTDTMRYLQESGNTHIGASSVTADPITFEYFKNTLYSLGASPADTVANASPMAKPASSQTPYFNTGDVTISSNWSVGAGETVVVFIDGNLSITGNPRVQVADGGFLAFIVSGNIFVDESVGNIDPLDETTNLEGLYFADGTLEIDSVGDAANQGDLKFVGAGSFVAKGGVTLERNFKNDADPDAALDNELGPVELFVARPDLLANMPDLMKKPVYSWAEVAP